ncbi:MAG: hypothetical protein RL190_2116 [Actinomycetota bacterium]|jgi:hypothetical protein
MDGAIALEDLQAAIHAAYHEDREPVAIRLHPATLIHVSDPALGLEPLGASELDAFDGLPIEIDPLVAIGAVAIRERLAEGDAPGYDDEPDLDP